MDGVFVTDLRADDPRPALPEELGVAAVTLNGPKVPSAAPAVCVDWCAAPSARRPDHRAANPGRPPTAEPTPSTETPPRAVAPFRVTSKESSS